MMKRGMVIALCMFVLASFSFVFTNAEALDINAAFQKIKTELLKKGLTPADTNAVETPTKSILSQGGAPGDIKNMVLEFANKGFKGTSLESLVSMVNDLMKNGDSLKLAKSIVSQALQKGSASGLQGDALIAKVRELVGQHKEKFEGLKNNIGSKLGLIKK